MSPANIEIEISQYRSNPFMTRTMGTLSPLPRPEPWTRRPSFLSVNAEERATFDLTAKASFNVLCQDCKNILPVPFELPASDTLRQIDQGFHRECKVHQLCKSAADGCHLYTLLLTEIPEIIAGTSNFNRWKDGTVVSMEVRPIAHHSSGNPVQRNQDELMFMFMFMFTYKGVQETHHDLTLKMKPSITSEPHELPCRSIFTGSDECIERCRLWLQQCVESHPECRRRTPLNPPTRLVEILDAENVQVIEPTTSMPYFTLSYCWRMCFRRRQHLLCSLGPQYHSRCHWSCIQAWSKTHIDRQSVYHTR
jgi:hypothetical protein